MRNANVILNKPNLINTVSRPLAHQCSQCGKHYYRRNLVEAWTIRSPGKRIGWHKEIAKVCLACMDARQSEQIVGVCDVQFSKREIIRKK